MKRIFLLLVLVGQGAFASTPSLDNLTNAELQETITDFAAVLNHVSVSPATPLGKVFGVELGLIAGMVETPGIEKVTKSVDPTSDFSSLPHATLFGAVSFPLGFTAEVNFLPKMNVEDIDFKNTSVGVKWTFSELLTMPVDMALRVSATSSELTFTQDSPVPGTTVTLENKSTEAILMISKNFLIVEPFAGIGYVSTDGDVSASSDIFTDINGTSASKNDSAVHYLVGANFNLLFLKLGIEAGKLFDAEKVSAKVSFYF